MNLETQIRQQQSTVSMLTKLVKAKRSSPDELAQAQRRLADLEGQQTFKPIAAPQTAVRPERSAPELSMVQLVGDEYARLQAELSKEADQLQRKIAALSNQLHLVPPTVACPELTKPILALVAQREAVWDKKRYLERNRCLPEPEPEPASTLPTLPGDDGGRYELAYQKRRLIDLKSKLRRKLENPKAKPGKRVEWETELVQCERKIQEIEFKLS